MSDARPCPGCGSLLDLDQVGWGEELCPGCLLRLALQPSAVEGKRAAELETDYMPARTEGPLAPGRVLGNRYAVRKLLGRGGMGEVWRAYDLKLRVDVALKALREDLFRDQKRLELLRSEVRAAREVVSPNVCRIFDLIEADGTELVSMEYIDGATLLEVLQEGGPLPLEEARDIASQFLAGLEAIHKAGLVHRDVKPENIMITRAGRVVVMDFGLARQEDSGAGTVAGTPAYMAPEQAAGLHLDARADVYAAGVVLAEMVSPEGVTDPISRQSIWAGIRSEPVRVPETPWAPVIARAVAKERERRYNSAHTLIRALEDRTMRVDGAEDLQPYPGLASFTENDAEFFFGREAEVERLWRRLDRPHLLGVVGPSGSGKTSFLRAGLVATAADDWSIVRCTPGDAALASLRRALAAEVGDDPEAVAELAAADSHSTVLAYSRWRSRYRHALLIVDQFEELFTLNPSAVQADMAELLSRLALEADVFVLLAMRDDFLMGCRDHQPLAPVFEDLTALPSLSGGALRRAMVQPAAKCGYRFEDDELVEEMLAEVGGERGALPLLAFAMARLWEKRDRDNGLLTRQAYHDIGGVGGALARHAEETIERIGSGRVPIVRELFRNLVTSEGTRAVREWDELLSVFGEPLRQGAEEVLRALVDARLLTSYEVSEEDREPVRRVEVIHESLLAKWPRLVRWQTQDVDAAQLRDQLRQAARTWDERGRPDDLLWTGSAYREFALWRERYPGGLTATEDAFAAAMTSLAGRRRRRRRMAVASLLTVAATVAASTTWLWRRSVLQERLAEAQKLVALGQLQLEDYPTATIAHAIQSLELADTEEARLLALEALWKGPTASIVNLSPCGSLSFNPSGTQLVQGHVDSSSFAVISRDGLQRVLNPDLRTVATRFFGSDDLFIVAGYFENWGKLGLWSVSEGRLLASADLAGAPEIDRISIGIGGDAVEPRTVVAAGTGSQVTVEALYRDGRRQSLGALRTTAPIGQGASFCVPAKSDQWIGLVEGNRVSVVTIGDDGLSDRQVLGRHDGDLVPACEADPLGRFVVTINRSSGHIRLWDVTGRRRPSKAEFSGDVHEAWPSSDGSYFWLGTSASEGGKIDVSIWAVEGLELRLFRTLERIESSGKASLDPTGRWLAIPDPPTRYRVWSLANPVGAEPIALHSDPGGANPGTPRFSPDGRWLATGGWSGLRLWPLARSYPVVLRIEAQAVLLGGVRFAPDGRFLAAAVGQKLLRMPLEGQGAGAARTMFEHEDLELWGVEVSPDGSLVAGATLGPGQVWIGRSDGTQWRQIPGVASGQIAFSPDGRLLAMNPAFWEEVSTDFHIWDVTTMQEVATLHLPDAEYRVGASFTPDGRLLTGTSDGIVAWDVDTGDHELLIEFDVHGFVASEDGRKLVVADAGGRTLREVFEASTVFFDLDTGESTVLNRHGSMWAVAAALDREGRVLVTSDAEGVIRVGPVTGEEPHLLLGHEGGVDSIAIDPLGRWIASSSVDKTIRLWPMPDLSKPPLHTLPRQELIAKLKTLTNVRLVRDEESSTGWTLTHDPFPGWETAPTW